MDKHSPSVSSPRSQPPLPPFLISQFSREREQWSERHKSHILSNMLTCMKNSQRHLRRLHCSEWRRELYVPGRRQCAVDGAGRQHWRDARSAADDRFGNLRLRGSRFETSTTHESRDSPQSLVDQQLLRAAQVCLCVHDRRSGDLAFVLRSDVSVECGERGWMGGRTLILNRPWRLF